MSTYEEKIDALLQSLGSLHNGKMDIEVSKNSPVPEYSETEWTITPHNPNAAKVVIYGVDDRTVNLYVDEVYWLEVFMRPKRWDKDLEKIRDFLDAIMSGRIEGWHSTDVDSAPRKTILELHTSKRTRTYTGNLLFTNRFKQSKGTKHRTYEAY